MPSAGRMWSSPSPSGLDYDQRRQCPDHQAEDRTGLRWQRDVTPTAAGPGKLTEAITADRRWPTDARFFGSAAPYSAGSARSLGSRLRPCGTGAPPPGAGRPDAVGGLGRARAPRRRHRDPGGPRSLPCRTGGIAAGRRGGPGHRVRPRRDQTARPRRRRTRRGDRPVRRRGPVAAGETAWHGGNARSCCPLRACRRVRDSSCQLALVGDVVDDRGQRPVSRVAAGGCRPG